MRKLYFRSVITKTLWHVLGSLGGDLKGKPVAVNLVFEFIIGKQTLPLTPEASSSPINEDVSYICWKRKLVKILSNRYLVCVLIFCANVAGFVWKPASPLER